MDELCACYKAFHHSYYFSGFGPACLQEHADLEHILPENIYNNIVKNMEYSENCLFLDIYVPGTIQPNR